MMTKCFEHDWQGDGYCPSCTFVKQIDAKPWIPPELPKPESERKEFNFAPAYIQALTDAMSELQKATTAWPVFNSAHEGFAVLSEEHDELWEHVKTNQKRRQLDLMYKEAIQVAAMALRFAAEVCNEERGRK